MKGIYLTQDAKQQIEAKIAELEKPFMEWSKEDDAYEKYSNAQVYKEILASATILPVEKSWGKIIFNGEDEVSAENDYPNGVIIQPKF